MRRIAIIGGGAVGSSIAYHLASHPQFDGQITVVRYQLGALLGKGPVKAMLLELDCRKATAFLCPLIEKSAGAVPIRAQLQKFAADSGLQI